jgi:hypothetical protein
MSMTPAAGLTFGGGGGKPARSLGVDRVRTKNTMRRTAEMAILLINF